MWDLQMELVNHYIEIEKVPPPVWELDVKEHQINVKDFLARVTEELGEGFESYEIMYENRAEPHFDNIPYLQNLNEEISDALHFLIEASIFTGVTIENILHGFRRHALNDLEWARKDLLTYFLLISRRLNEYSISSFIGKMIAIPENEDLAFLQGGRHISKKGLDELAVRMWDVTFSIQLARNSLKNKPWKQTNMRTDENQFKHHMVQAWIKMFRLLEYMGYNEEGIFTIYFKKNRVNLFRIKSKY